MIEIDKNGYFITGSDTDAGKTYIACEIIRQIRACDLAVTVRKPAESGCEPDAQGNLTGADAFLLNQANHFQDSLEAIAPYRFRAALAPHRAARLEGKQLYMHQLVEACQAAHADHRLLVEGAGGFYSPLAEDGLNADLASALQLPVIIVVNDRIGAVNQALMTISAVENRHLPIAAVIMNRVDARHADNMDNLADLGAWCDYPLFQCHHRQHLADIFKSS